MRLIQTGLLAGASCVALVMATAGQPPQSPQPPARPAATEAPGLPGIPVPAVPAASDSELAGLPGNSRPEPLTWQRVYALALVRARAGGATAAAEALDPKALADAATRHGVADFARFRADFLAGRPGAGGPFRDPSRDYLVLLRRLQAIDTARTNVAVHENLRRLVQEVIQGSSAGPTQLDADLVGVTLVRARQELSDEIRDFRDGLDDLKIALGLSPRAAVIPDRASLAAFRGVFEAVEAWARNPNRNLHDLSVLVDRLPALGDVVVEGQPILGRIESEPGRLEPSLTAAGRIALKNRLEPAPGQAPGDADVALERQVRRRIRHLSAMQQAYDGQKRTYLLALLLKDQAFERLFAPQAPTGSAAARSPLLAGLLEQVDRVRKAQDRLVALWTAFRAERLALYRELGTLPYGDWSSFYADLAAQPASVRTDRPAQAVAPPPPPAPPAPAPASGP
jgi:hypothetical protein